MAVATAGKLQAGPGELAWELQGGRGGEWVFMSAWWNQPQEVERAQALEE